MNMWNILKELVGRLYWKARTLWPSTKEIKEESTISELEKWNTYLTTTPALEFQNLVNAYIDALAEQQPEGDKEMYREFLTLCLLGKHDEALECDYVFYGNAFITTDLRRANPRDVSLVPSNSDTRENQ